MFHSPTIVHSSSIRTALNVASTEPVSVEQRLTGYNRYNLGIDHRRLTFRFQGLDQRLTGVEEAHVVEKIIS